MQPLQYLVPIGVLTEWAEWIPYVVLGLVLVNVVTRFVAHRKHRKQAADSDDGDDVSHSAIHTVSTLALILASFAFLLVEPHGGMVLSILVLGMFVADFFEVESRRVEARNDLSFQWPKSAMFLWVLVFFYAVYQSLFFLIGPYWNQVI